MQILILKTEFFLVFSCDGDWKQSKERQILSVTWKINPLIFFDLILNMPENYLPQTFCYFDEPQNGGDKDTWLGLTVEK